MKVIEKLGLCGVIPVVVIEQAEDAVSTAKALLSGGVDTMEITFRTAAAADSISLVTKEVPEMTVGAGTILNLEQCIIAIEAGAQFIVSPGFDRKIVEYCLKNDIAIIPGCVTPTEIMEAIDCGLKIVKFFPANVYGGLSAIKALSAPFRDIQFIPTGGVNAGNLEEYISAPFIYAVGGSWMCKKDDISANNFEKITELCFEAKKIVFGFEVAHIGLNTDSPDASMEICEMLNYAFGFSVKTGNSSNFAGQAIEVMKSQYLGRNGHIAIRTNSIPRAMEALRNKGFEADETTAKYKGERMTAIYLKNEFGGFAVHLLQK